MPQHYVQLIKASLLQRPIIKQSKRAHAGGCVAPLIFLCQSRKLLWVSLHAESLLIPIIVLQVLPICSSREIYGRPTSLLHSGLSVTETTRWVGSTSGRRVRRVTCLCSWSWRWRNVQVLGLEPVSAAIAHLTQSFQRYSMILRGHVVPKGID